MKNRKAQYQGYPPPPDGGYYGADGYQYREKKKWKDNLGLPGWSILLLVPLIILLALFIMIVFVGRPYVVKGISMQPTLHEGDRVFVVKYRFGRSPSRGDVIVLKDVIGDTEMLIKRVVALGGDTVTVQQGSLMVNDKFYHKSTEFNPDEPYTTIVPKGYIFVMGDNESKSFDSRTFGPVKLDKVVGRAVMIFWPPGDFQKL